MNDKKKKLDEKAILKRLSNGKMYHVIGGYSPFMENDKEQAPIDTCLAGCGCTHQPACSRCQA